MVMFNLKSKWLTASDMQIKLSFILVGLMFFFKPVSGQLKQLSGYLLVHKNAGLGENVRQKEVILIFQGKYTRWPQTKAPVTIVMPSSKHPNAAAVSRILGFINFKEMQKYWLSMVFQGRFSAPLFLDTDQEIIEYILRNNGAVGVISAEQANPAEKYTYSLIFQ